MSESVDKKALAMACAEEMMRNDFASRALDMQIEDMDEGYARVSMKVRQDMLNGHATCHGGMIFSLADSAFAFACNSQNLAAVAASCSIDYLLPGRENDVLTAIADVAHQGARNGVYDIKVSNQRGEQIALFRGRSARIKTTVLPVEETNKEEN
jgi:acyl-CoA thioesterase